MKSSHSGTVIDANRATLQTVQAIVSSLSDTEYTYTSDGQSSVGKHVRHILDFYRCFLDGLDAGMIDYDCRRRDVRIESTRRIALTALTRIHRELGAISPGESTLLVYSSVDDTGAISSTSTSRRELMFLQTHSTHHLSIVATIMRSLGVAVDDSLGVAPSTLAHESRQTCGGTTRDRL